MRRIDRLLVSKHFRILSFQQSACEHSDHDCITAQLHFESSIVVGKSFWRNNIKLYSAENFVDQFKEFWEETKKKKLSLYYGNLNKWWLEMKYDLKRMLRAFGRTHSTYENREINMMRHTLSIFEYVAVLIF